MTTALPPSTDFTDASVTEAQFKTAISSLRTFLADQMGTTGTVATALATMGTLCSAWVAKTGAYTVLTTDRGKLIGCSGTFSLSLTAAATLGDGFSFAVLNYGTGSVTIDPNSTEQIDGATTIVLAAGESCIVVCTGGTAFRTLSRSSSTLATASVNGLMSSTYAAKLDGIEAGANVGLDTDAGSGAVGILLVLKNNTAPISPGSTVAGTSLYYTIFDSTGVCSAVSVSPSGTWRNVCGLQINTSEFGMFQRIS